MDLLGELDKLFMELNVADNEEEGDTVFDLEGVDDRLGVIVSDFDTNGVEHGAGLTDVVLDTELLPDTDDVDDPLVEDVDDLLAIIVFVVVTQTERLGDIVYSGLMLFDEL
jgi:hypothetical protein